MSAFHYPSPTDHHHPVSFPTVFVAQLAVCRADNVAHRPVQRQKSTRRYALCLPNGVPPLPPPPTPPLSATAATPPDENTAPVHTHHTPQHLLRHAATVPRSRMPTQRATPVEGILERPMPTYSWHRRPIGAPSPAGATPLEGVPERMILPDHASPAAAMTHSTPMEGVLERLHLPPRTQMREIAQQNLAAATAAAADLVATSGGYDAPHDQGDGNNNIPDIDFDGSLNGGGGVDSDDDDDHHGDPMDMDTNQTTPVAQNHAHASPRSMDAKASSPLHTPGTTTQSNNSSSPGPISGIRPRKSLGLSRFAGPTGGEGPSVECALGSLPTGQDGHVQGEVQEEGRVPHGEGGGHKAPGGEKKGGHGKGKGGGRKRRDLSPGSMLFVCERGRMMLFAMFARHVHNGEQHIRRNHRNVHMHTYPNTLYTSIYTDDSMLQYAIKTPAPTAENDGRRRSKRQKFAPMRYWINEHKSYARKHESTTCVYGCYGWEILHIVCM